MHIYPWQIAPLQSSIDALNTATPNLCVLTMNVCAPHQYGQWEKWCGEGEPVGGKYIYKYKHLAKSHPLHP